jgi:hypothetical protein
MITRRASPRVVAPMNRMRIGGNSTLDRSLRALEAGILIQALTA